MICLINHHEVVKSTYALCFTILNILFTFSSQIDCFGPGIFSTYKIDILYIVLIDKSSQFCNTGNKNEVAITCAFWRRLRRSLNV